MKKIIKRYICPYCGKEYNDKNWTFDHIIPLDMGGPKKFKLISCTKCNSKLSRNIEQTAMRSSQIIGPIGELTSEGFKIKSRRKRKLLPMHRNLGMSMGKRVKFYYDMEQNGQPCLIFLEPPPPELFKQKKEGIIIIPKEEDSEKLQIGLSSLGVKIVLGTCCWIWGNKFSMNTVGDNLRDCMWNRTIEDILDIGSESKHAAIKIENTESNNKGELETDAFGNKPHHTISIFEIENNIYAIINIFGGYESMMWLGKKQDIKEFIEIEKGIVIIAKTTENTLLSMNLDEYEYLKTHQLEIG